MRRFNNAGNKTSYGVIPQVIKLYITIARIRGLHRADFILKPQAIEFVILKPCIGWWNESFKALRFVENIFYPSRR
jgi:hypothetical protein